MTMDATITATEHAYLTRSGQPIMARVYRSTSTPDEGAPVVVDVHGGAWSAGDRSMGEHYDRALAERGFLVAAIDFRQSPGSQHPAGSADVTWAVRWIRASADLLGADGSRIGLVGSSSGGHLAVLAACRPDEPEHLQPAPDLDPVRSSDAEPQPMSASVSCVAALWPPVDPLARYRFALERLDSGPPELRERYASLVKGSTGYFGSEPVMAQASIARIVEAGEARALPPLWICYPSEDTNVPRPIVDHLRDAWAGAGGQVQMTVYEGELHGFGHRPGPASGAFIEELSAFLLRHLGSVPAA
jgi:acetyl esterase/lipase